MALVEINQLKQSPTTQSTEKFIDDTIEQQLPDLTILTLDELAARYNSIDQQSQLFKGLILLQARERLPSNKEFGNWIKSIQALCLDNQPTLTRYMNFAKYFKDKDRTGISLTAAYEISAPANEDVADKIYEYALNKNLPVSEIKAQIQIEKGIRPESDSEIIDVESQAKQALHDFKKSVMSGVKKVPQQDAIKVLQDCIKQIRADIKATQNQSKKETNVQDAEVVTAQEPETTETSPASEDTEE
ncbi:MAG: hypothetical protein WCL34_13065 [Methylococcaceae bacterium]